MLEKMILLFVSSILIFVCSEALPNLFQYEVENAKNFVHQFEMQNDRQSFGVKEPFSWKDCSSASPLVSIKSLSLSPDPLAFPGPLILSTEFTTKADLDSPLKAKLKVEKKTFGVFVEVPCIDNIGSCTYDDVCQLLSQIPSGQCPDPLTKAGINCACPLKQNSYDLQKAEFDITASIIPSGEYRIVADVTQNGAEVVCLDMKLTVE